MSNPPHIGFQAVILCGPGTSLHPFTGTSATDLPKALLPIANKPMLQYPLEWCEKTGFSSILILTLTEHFLPIQSYIFSHASPVTIRVEAPSSLNESLGTADALRIAYRNGWVTGDFAVVPCDLVTNLDGLEILKMWIVDQPAFDAGMGSGGRKGETAREDNCSRRGAVGVWYETKGTEGTAKGKETDFIAVAPQASAVPGNGSPQSLGSRNTLLFNLPTGAEESPVSFRRCLLRKHPNYQLISTRRDSGIYYFPFWVLMFLENNWKINSIREDLLPWWSKCCWQNKELSKRMGLIDILAESGAAAVDNTDDVGDMSSTRRRNTSKWAVKDNEKLPEYSAEELEIIAKAKRGIIVLPIRKIEARKLEVSPKINFSAEVKIPSITAYLPSPSTAFIRRVDTIQLYLSTSLYFASLSIPSSHRVHTSAEIDPKAFVTHMDCLIAAKVVISEKAVVKRCVLGSRVSIGKGAKLLGCVIMDGAMVADGANLEGCVVGRRATIGLRANLKNCQVAGDFFVDEDIQAKNECFVEFSDLNDSDVAAGLGIDGTHDRDGDAETDDTESENDQRIDDSDEQPPKARRGKPTSDKEQIIHGNIERTKEVGEGQNDDDGYILRMLQRLERINDLPRENRILQGGEEVEEGEEGFIPAQGGNEKTITVKETTTDLVTHPEKTARLPAASTSNAQCWFWWLLLVGTMIIIGHDIWYAITKAFGNYGDNIQSF